MSNVQTRLDQIEQHLTKQKEKVALGDKIAKLVKTPLFREVIVDTFSTQECARYAQESADPMLTAEQRADALAMAQAAGHLRRWLAIQLQMSELAARDIPEIEEEITRVRQDDGDDGQWEGA